VSERRTRQVVAISCVMCLVALALMVWSILAPTPLSVMIAMSVAQGIGTLSLLLYLWAVIADLRRARVFDDRKDG
jgi:type III secretory pathway component EscT